VSLASPRLIAPSIKEKAFNCPHCGALAKQFWHHLLADPLGSDSTPISLTTEDAEHFGKDIKDKEEAEKLRQWALRISKKLPFLENSKVDPYAFRVWNVAISKCFNCADIALWLSDRQVYPEASTVMPPNPDLPDDAKFDYREAASIVEKSPRGAAALLRLALQKLCLALGGHGKNINEDIGLLVKNGLDIRVQQALDIVRVTGNNAVHPGEMDLRDDKDTAGRLFSLVNLIADILISQPKEIAAVYEGLPAGARQAVTRRDAS
jgi:hypothetical protein